jgi:isopenicillin N synthase-like dioxygenase
VGLTLAILEKTLRGRSPQARRRFTYRLDIVNQKRGDFKETFNMGKFADPTYEQKLPPILASHWHEIQAFQKECHVVTLHVLTLFALALDVLPVLYHCVTVAPKRLFYETAHSRGRYLEIPMLLAESETGCCS